MWSKRSKTPDGSGSLTPEEEDNEFIDDNEPEKKNPSTSTDGSVIPGSEPVTPSRRDAQLWEFLSTNRSARRNAITNVLRCHAKAGMLELPNRFEDLTVNIGQSKNGAHDPNTPGTSKQQG
ncbi:uncharacterized protein LOC143355174 isoform X1 [Halictus rubicundus]|uniref:uncharacterized protein LOC143355174 isoform X1 n=1 Tax=Halictus rubicundus TaxID=77578 RepID=UPI0040370146